MPISTLKNTLVTKYAHVSSSQGVNVELYDELHKIGNAHYKALILPCRLAYNENPTLYSKLKLTLPSITFCGTFNGRHRAEDLAEYNNIMLVDIDKISSDEIIKIKEKALNDPYIFACWLSPSGHGLKTLIRIDSTPTMHKFYFSQVEDYLFSNYGIQADLSGSDICRLCFISYDENIIIKADSKTFPIHEESWLLDAMAVHTKEGIEPIRNVSGKTKELFSTVEKQLKYKTEGRNKFSEKELLRKIIIYLRKNILSITDSYSNWIKVGFAIANSFTFDIGQAFFLELCRLDGNQHDEYKSERQIELCYIKRKPDEVKFASITYLAIKKGFVLNPLKSIRKT